MTRRYVWAVLLPKTLVARGDGGDARLQRRPVYVRVEMLIWKHRLADGLPGGRQTYDRDFHARPESLSLPPGLTIL